MAAVIPPTPGEAADPFKAKLLGDKLAEACGLDSVRFPGSQPVSFKLESMDVLEQKDFWVCEKSDGVRVLLFIVINVANNNTQETWMVDRKLNFKMVRGLEFSQGLDSRKPLRKTVIDGELVYDIEPTGEVRIKPEWLMTHRKCLGYMHSTALSATGTA